MFSNLFKTYRVGSELVSGETILAMSTTKWLDYPPADFDERSLATLSNLPPTNDERLIVTNQHLVYKTDYEIIRFIKDTMLKGANQYAPDMANQIIQYLASQVNTDDQSLWIPWNDIYSAQALVFRAELSGIFGTRQIPFYYYEIELSDGKLWFLQNPVNHRSAESAAQAMQQAFSG